MAISASDVIPLSHARANFSELAEDVRGGLNPRKVLFIHIFRLPSSVLMAVKRLCWTCKGWCLRLYLAATVLDLIRLWLEHIIGWTWMSPSPSFSLYAFSEVLTEMPHLSNARLVVPPTSTAPTKGKEQEQLGLLGTAADRASRNKLQAPWLVRKLAAWL